MGVNKTPPKRMLGYCGPCKMPLGVSTSHVAPSHVDAKDQKTHVGTMVEIATDEAAAVGELPADFLARLCKKYVPAT